jgi:hypothetical protein
VVAGLEAFLCHEDKLAIEEFHGLEEQRVLRVGQPEVLRREDPRAAHSYLQFFRILRHALEICNEQLLGRLGVEGFAVVGLWVEGLGIENTNLLAT